ncbi:MAG: UDP-3-O-(3-hydroxymyristoyl) glucosamine N-acyltransferase [Deltaproteobacteria bacterium ADurb.Bin510]|nr:MAG: UDP-3-O-(3-hydroxymyristoyl) glucosamine N-acyltransferase [Deltaproteobacteria bacterium ADurb.Bin510]
MILSFNGHSPKIGQNVFIAENATIIGDVEIGDGASVWFGAVIRGDMAPIRIGCNTSIQDNCTVHTDLNMPCTIGANVTVGHNAVVHSCTVEDRVLIGIGANVLNRAVIKTGSIVAAGSLVREGQNVGPFELVTGVPAEVKKTFDESIYQKLDTGISEYLELSAEYLKHKLGC